MPDTLSRYNTILHVLHKAVCLKWRCISILAIINIIIIIIVIIIIELTHGKTILEITVEIKPQLAALDFKNLSQYSSRSK